MIYRGLVYVPLKAERVIHAYYPSDAKLDLAAVAYLRGVSKYVKETTAPKGFRRSEILHDVELYTYRNIVFIVPRGAKLDPDTLYSVYLAYKSMPKEELKKVEEKLAHIIHDLRGGIDDDI